MPQQILGVGEKMARLEAYEEILGPDSASITVDARKKVYGSYPLGGSSENWMHRGAEESKKYREWWSALSQRLLAAFFGGYALLVPMLIMTLSPTLITALVTTIVCVLWVATFIAIQFSTAGPTDLLGIIAAYAAVLVVFVGTSKPTETLTKGVVARIVFGVLLGSTGFAFLFCYLSLYARAIKLKIANIVYNYRWRASNR
jgi:hypothetical protein